MRTKLMGIALTALLASSAFAGVASAHHKDGHDANSHGMCTAYFSGSENGQEKKRDNGNAFGTLTEEDGMVGDQDGDGDVDAYDLGFWCNENTGGFGNPGSGNDPYFGDSDCGYEEEDEGYADADDNGQDDRCDALENQPGGTTPGESNGNNKNKGGDGEED